MENPRKIIHIDMDAFYASVEQRNHPELRGKPVVVGGRPGKRGVVAAASYEARRFGIHSAMPSTRAQQRCPEAIFVRPNFDVYRQVSQQVRRIFHQYTDLVEPLSLDEAYLDVTTNKKEIPSATWIANQIREQIRRETRLSASAGVAPNKFLAKIASDINKPNGICVIPPEKVTGFIEELAIGKFYGIGKATEKRMFELGIQKGIDLKRFAEADLVRHFGKVGHFYFKIVRGIDDRAVQPHRIRKSVGVEETFDEDLLHLAEMEKVLKALAGELERRLIKSEMSGKTVTLKLRYADFETITRSKTQANYLQKAADFFPIVRLMMGNTDAVEKKVRLLGITISNLDNVKAEAGEIQLPLPFDYDF